MTEDQLALIEDIRAENAVLFSFVQAVIATHHSPRLLLEAFDVAHNQLIGPLLAEAKPIDARLERIEDQRRRLVQRLEARIRPQRPGGA